MKLIIGNRAYSSWSMRGWLALKHAGFEFEELVVPLFDESWEKQREGDEFARSLAAEMHSGFANLRRELPMNVRKNFGSVKLSSEVEAEVNRILNLWAQA